MECSKLGGQWKEKEKLLMFGGQRKEKEKLLMFGGQRKEKEKLLMFGGQRKEKEKLPMLSGQWKEKEKLPFHLFPLPPQATYLGLRPFPLTSRFYFTIVISCYLCIPFFCPWPINYDAPFNVTSTPHFRYRFGLVEDPFFFA